MENHLKLTKGRIIEKISRKEYLIVDIFTDEKMTMFLSGKQQMNYLHLEIGEEVYARYSTLSGKRCKLTTMTDFKLETNGLLSRQKAVIDRKQKALGL